ncbi:MAG: DUF4956 domain-containing protein [Christensenellales bacterium]|jgi:hypothetical protein
MNDGTTSIRDVLSTMTDLSGSTLSPLNVIITLALACALGLFIFFIYRKTFSGVMYSRNFGLSLVMVTMITALIILPITSNLTLSLGMVGALSIVRFRTAVKDAMDTMFMFWGIAVGICMGAKFWAVGLVGSLAIGLLMVLLSVIKFRTSLPYLLILHFDLGAAPNVKAMLGKLPTHKLKSRTVRGNSVEMTVELRLRNEETGFVDKLTQLDGMYDASLISYQGDIIS